MATSRRQRSSKASSAFIAAWQIINHALPLAGGLHAPRNFVLWKDMLHAGLLHASVLATLARNCCGEAAAHDCGSRSGRCCCH
jgi:hypothetical protein